MSGIEDKVVAITGAGSGIGEATALPLVKLACERYGKLDVLVNKARSRISREG